MASESHYILLTTFKRDGTPVGSAVWAAEQEGALYIWTETESFKVKRIRRNSSVQVCDCTFAGKPTGPARAGSATLLDEAGTALTRSLLARKYGLMGAVAVRWPWPSYFTPSRKLFRDMLTGRRPETVGIRVDLGDGDADGKA